MTSALGAIVTGRNQSYFSNDIEKHRPTLRERIEGRRILALGGAGSIGTETIKSVLRFNPKSVHVVDHNENALAELVRHLRSRPDGLQTEDFRTYPIDFGGAATRALLFSEPAYDIVLNFAAIKHVRSEKDIFSLAQMFETNIVKQARFLGWLNELRFAGNYFSVSTDKAADPSSFMGASKRIMEHVLFNPALSEHIKGKITSARFANVAFSNGSLLQSFEMRMQRNELMACPLDIRRYFVSLEESGDICTLSSLLLEDRHIGIPRLDPEKHLVLLETVVDQFLHHHNLTPRHYENEEEARAAFSKDRAEGAWPVVMTKPNTAGEKLYEQFVAEGERVVEPGLKSMQAIAYDPDGKNVVNLLTKLEKLFVDWMSCVPQQMAAFDKNTFKNILAEIEPGFTKSHHESQANLDQRV